VDGQITLSELNAYIKESLEVSFPEQIWVIAEIGELKVNRNGHCYLELSEKDNSTDEIKARSRATIWSWQFRFIQPYFETTTGEALQAGIKVLVAVTIEFHEVYGISLNIKDIDPTYTLGDLARKRQEIINRLMADGIFDMNKEIPISDIPNKIAIISSPTAAGYEDFINQLQENESGYQFFLKIFPASMQGKDAAASIIQALDAIYNWEEFFDVVVIIRGGGSQMDLLCFDDYELADHIAQFPIPVLTGIGHEKDESIADLVAHTSLKTPTAVAEFLIGRLDEVAGEINELESSFLQQAKELIERETTRLNQAFRLFKPLIGSKLERTELKLQHLAQNIQPIVNEVIEHQKFLLEKYSDHLKFGSNAFFKFKNNHLNVLINQTDFVSHLNYNKAQQKLIGKMQLLIQITKIKLAKEKNRLDWLTKTNELVDPKSILKRGFSITLKNGKAVTNESDLKNGEELETVLYKGKVKSIVKK